jgi:hypothetical protein
VVTRNGTGGLDFSLDAFRQVGLHSGHVHGSVARYLPTAWTHRSPYGSCRLVFTRSALGVVVKQDDAFGDCQFGYGVTASGTYVRISSNPGDAR